MLAVGPYLCALSLPALDLLSRAAVDAATYFGVYHAVSRQRYISHGELEVARVSYDGEVVWRVGGGDIFTGGFALYEDHVEVVDWNDHEYRIDLATGACVAGEV